MMNMEISDKTEYTSNSFHIIFNLESNAHQILNSLYANVRILLVFEIDV